MEGFKFIYSKLSAFRAELFIILFFMSIPLVFGVVQPILLGSLIDSLTSNHSKKSLFLVAVILLVGLLSILFSALYKRRIFITLNQIQLKLKMNIIERIMSLNINKFRSLSNGELINKIENDSKIFAGSLSDFTKFIADFIGFIIILIILFNINTYLSICILAICPVITISFSFYGKLVKKTDKRVKQQLDYYLNNLNDMLERFNLIKLFAAETMMTKKYKEELEDYQTLLFNKNNLNIQSGVTVELLNLISQVVILVWGIYFINKNQMTIGDLVAFSTYSSNFNYTLLRFSQFNLMIQETINSIKRIEDVLEFRNSNVRKKDCKPQFFLDKKFSNKDIVLGIHNLSYKFFDSNKFILDQINSDFTSSKSFQISGSNGSGKTTLLHILAGLIDDYQGDLIYKGVNVKDIPYSLYRQKVCLVPQEHEMISGSIRENFLLAKKNATVQEIQYVCSMVEISEFIDSSENGYDTLIGSNGINLSTGQKQKLSLARALLVDAEVYLFDEITSALDKENKIIAFKIISYLKNQRNKTVIMISHDDVPEGLIDQVFELSN